jgi:polyhydroxyalkanoate synthesis regulator phasin
MARRVTDTLISRLRQLSEDAVSTIFDEFKTNRGLRRGLERASERFKANKGVLDRNVELLLDLANLPSKRDFRELRERVERLTGQVVNLNLKLDRLLNQLAGTAPISAPRKSRHRSKHEG